MNDTPPLGQRFSHVYLKRGQPTSDSARMRRRLLAVHSLNLSGMSIAGVLEAELGIRLELDKTYYRGFDKFFLEGKLNDLLDAVTLIWRKLQTLDLRANDDPDNSWFYYEGIRLSPSQWISEVRRIFQEENVGYTVDDQGGVHPAVDAEFEHNKASVIKGLGSSRYNGVLTEFEKAYAELDKIPPEGKNAMRSAFEAVEILFKLMFPAQRLGVAEIRQHLEPVVQSHLSSDTTASRATLKILESFKDWVSGVQYYRHGQGEEEPVQPPLSLAILIVSTAASYLRWLAEIDAERQNPP